MALLPVEAVVLVPRLRRSTKLSRLMCGSGGICFIFSSLCLGFWVLQLLVMGSSFVSSAILFSLLNCQPFWVRDGWGCLTNLLL
jgi:hypothetical protein